MQSDEEISKLGYLFLQKSEFEISEGYEHWTLDRKYIGIRKSEFVTKIELL